MYKYKAVLAYDGTDFIGWQAQPLGVSIQSEVERAFSTVLRFPIRVVGSSRTDAGVHAKGQVAHLETPFPIDLFRASYSINHLLPASIRLILLENSPLKFHARYSALTKEYHYHLHLDKTREPFKNRYAYHVRFPLDLTVLKQACNLFVGTKDFTSFSNESHRGSAAKNPVRTLHRLSVCEQEGGVRLEFVGDGFLYKMVRNITGTLVEVARGKFPISHIDRLFHLKDRKLAGMTAPPHGLFLMDITYPTFKD